MYDQLLKPFKLNAKFTLQNKVVFAPSTRCFADNELCATDEMANYYKRRSDAGLIISEATLISKSAQGYPNQPGIFTQKQINSWQNVNKEIHKNKGKSFCQLFHAGRVSHKSFHGEIPGSASRTRLSGKIPRTSLEYDYSKELTVLQIKNIIQDFVNGAKNALKAGFDGVELHCANGYLPDQFLHQLTNERDDNYGGSVAKRAAFVLELVDETIKAIGGENIGIRFSPHAYLHLSPIKNDEQTFIFLLEELNKRNIAYVHSAIIDDKEYIDYLDANVTEFLKRHYKGVVIANGSYTPKEADDLIKNNNANLVSFSRAFIANHDFIKKLEKNVEIINYNPSMLDELY